MRLSTLLQIDRPVILETHGGFGKLYAACYTAARTGVVLEKDPGKAAALARQRPHWAVYEADCEQAIPLGAGAHLEVNFVDLDPYGDPWPVMEAFFRSERPRADRLALVVNDGLRQACKMNHGWAVNSLAAAVAHFGNCALYPSYLEVARWLVMDKAAIAGYRLKSWTGYYCGHNGQMTHYAALLERT